MLNLSDIQKLSKKLQIAPLNIIREHVEMEVLHYLSQSDLSQQIIFYGGTALRLAYHGPRFSEDIDFMFTSSPSRGAKADLEQILQTVSQYNNGVRVEEVIMKRWTLFGLLHISHEVLKHPIRIKIEISKRRERIHNKPLLLTSDTTNQEVIFRCADLNSLAALKMKAMRHRAMPRDWFDYWYICHQLQQPSAQTQPLPFQKRIFANELKRWLPQNLWPMITIAMAFYE